MPKRDNIVLIALWVESVAESFNLIDGAHGFGKRQGKLRSYLLKSGRHSIQNWTLWQTTRRLRITVSSRRLNRHPCCRCYHLLWSLPAREGTVVVVVSSSASSNTFVVAGSFPAHYKVSVRQIETPLGDGFATLMFHVFSWRMATTDDGWKKSENINLCITTTASRRVVVVYRVLPRTYSPPVGTINFLTWYLMGYNL